MHLIIQFPSLHFLYQYLFVEAHQGNTPIARREEHFRSAYYTYSEMFVRNEWRKCKWESRIPRWVALVPPCVHSLHPRICSLRFGNDRSRRGMVLIIPSQPHHLHRVPSRNYNEAGRHNALILTGPTLEKWNFWKSARVNHFQLHHREIIWPTRDTEVGVLQTGRQSDFP